MQNIMHLQYFYKHIFSYLTALTPFL